MTRNLYAAGSTRARYPLALAAACGLLLGAAPVWAHHSIAAEFDMSKQWSETGILERVDWINPHTATWIQVKDPETGKTEEFGCEGGPPGRYMRGGLSPADWKAGEVVTLTCSQAKNGSKTWGFIRTLTYQSTGKVLNLGGGAFFGPGELPSGNGNGGGSRVF
jgi:hypothetical protein